MDAVLGITGKALEWVTMWRRTFNGAARSKLWPWEPPSQVAHAVSLHWRPSSPSILQFLPLPLAFQGSFENAWEDFNGKEWGRRLVMCTNIHLVKNNWNAEGFTQNRVGGGQSVEFSKFLISIFLENDTSLGVSNLYSPKGHLQVSLAEDRYDSSPTQNDKLTISNCVFSRCLWVFVVLFLTQLHGSQVSKSWTYLIGDQNYRESECVPEPLVTIHVT